MSTVLIVLPMKSGTKEYQTYFEFAFYNFLECIEEGERVGIDFSEDKKNLKDILDKVVNYDNNIL